MLTEAFKSAYAALNPRQKEAVDAVEGPVMVIAGPGTGKTRILTLRIANILAKTDTAPENILALTFTESAAANMRRRLTELIGPPGYYVEISTFHGYANRLIQEFPEYFPDIIGSRAATDVDQIAITREILDKASFEKLKPAGDKYYYVDDILRAITDAKREGYGPKSLRGLVGQKRREYEAHPGKPKLEYEKLGAALQKNEELAEIYEMYEKELRARRLYDFEDMILLTIKAFERHPNFLLEAEERAQYVLVDEHQDTNGAQNRLLEFLASFHASPNLFVVGDEKQAIYRFQGASLENFLYFKNKYPDARIVYLEDNYRSTQTILDAASELIAHNASTIKAPLTAKLGGEEKKISVIETGSPDAEYFFIAENIKRLIASGALPEEIAVLYRENRDAGPIAETLERAGIPFAIESERDVLADPDIKKLLKLLEAVHKLGDDESLAEALHIDFLGIPPLDIWKVLRARVERGYIPLYRLLTDKSLEELDLEEPAKMREAARAIERWKRRSKNESFLVFFEEVIRESGFLDHLLAHPGYVEKVSKLNTLFDEIKKAVGNRGDYNLEHFIAYLLILKEHRVMIKARPLIIPDRVRLMTAHRAKGLEFDHVFISGAVDGKWGNKRRGVKIKLPFRTAIEANELERNEDERRLFYMALTRARKHVTILHGSRNADGRELVPSQFIAEIRLEQKDEQVLRETVETAAKRRDLQFAPRIHAEPRLEDKEFLKDLFRRQGFSVTALNNYLKCPWQYFYSNLLRLPQAQTFSQMYGIAVHAALQKFFSGSAESKPRDKHFLLDRYEETLARLPLPEADRERMTKKGLDTLSRYYEHYTSSWSRNALTEYKVNGVALGEDVVLNGKLDKVEFLNAPSAGEIEEVAVVDYKTKKPESRNWIEGKTANSDGSYKRQLVFYKLLLNEDGCDPVKSVRDQEASAARRRLDMKKGIIDFVEPNERGIFKREEFEITVAEVEDIKKTILTAAEEILSLAFWDRKCDDKECHYCGLRDMLV